MCILDFQEILMETFSQERINPLLLKKRQFSEDSRIGNIEVCDSGTRNLKSS